jgi:hypothetical protein
VAVLSHDDTFGFETSLRLDTLAASAHAPARIDSRSERSGNSARKGSAEDARYRARENASAEAEEYRGGDALIIGASTATIILAVILLVILL